MAKKLGVTPQSLTTRIKQLRLKGVIRRISHYPALYELITPELQAEIDTAIRRCGISLADEKVKYVQGEVATKGNPRRVVEPHLFGEWFLIKKGVVRGGHSWVLRGGVVMRSWIEDDFSVLASPKKVVVWLKAFKGLTPAQLIVNGRTMIRKRAEEFAFQQGLELEYLCSAGKSREWNTTTIGYGLSDTLIDGLDLKKGARRVGDTTWVTDRSHPGLAEFSGDGERVADEFAKRLDFLVNRGPEILEGIIKSQEVMSAQLQSKMKERDVRDVV